MPHHVKVLLIGAGAMGLEYAKALKALGVELDVLGRGKASADRFTAATGVPVLTCPLAEYAAESGLPESVIVAVTMDQLAAVAQEAISAGAKRLLVEKPGGLNPGEVRRLGAVAGRNGTAVYIAYNRRFYASVRKALEITEADEGVTSFHFEFTEWSHTVGKLDHAPGVLGNWFFANSTHVVDLAFFLGGRPKQIACFTGGGLEWHPAAVFSGAGLSEKGALFSYHANWCAPGRWSIEMMTRRHRLIFRPLEKLQVQEIGSLSPDFVPLNDELDTRFKPGLYLQTEAFLSRSEESLLPIADYIRDLAFFEEINKPISRAYRLTL